MTVHRFRVLDRNPFYASHAKNGEEHICSWCTEIAVGKLWSFAYWISRVTSNPNEKQTLVDVYWEISRMLWMFDTIPQVEWLTIRNTCSRHCSTRRSFWKCWSLRKWNFNSSPLTFVKRVREFEIPEECCFRAATNANWTAIVKSPGGRLLTSRHTSVHFRQWEPRTVDMPGLVLSKQDSFILESVLYTSVRIYVKLSRHKNRRMQISCWQRNDFFRAMLSYGELRVCLSWKRFSLGLLTSKKHVYYPGFIIG